MAAILRFQRRFLLNYKSALSILSLQGYLMYRIINPFFQMLFFCTIAKYVYGSSDISPWVIGNAVVLCYFSAFFGVGQTFVAERSQGTLKTIISAPSKTVSVVLPRAIMQACDSLLSVLIGFLTGVIFFDFTMPLAALLPILLVLIVAILSAMGLGLLIGSFALLTRDINMLLNIASMALIALTGANFYVELLPLPLQGLSQLLPLTRSISLIRHLVAGQSLFNHITLFYTEMLIGFLYFILALLVFKIIENLSIKHATLDLY